MARVKRIQLPGVVIPEASLVYRVCTRVRVHCNSLTVKAPNLATVKWTTWWHWGHSQCPAAIILASSQHFHHPDLDDFWFTLLMSEKILLNQ